MSGRAVAWWMCLGAAAALATACGDDEGGAGPVRVAVDDQILEPPDAVVVSEVAIDRAGWVVIRADHIGIPSDIIGVASVERGLALDVEVALTRSATDGEVLWAELRYDEGTPGLFEPAIDPPARDGRGEPIARSFIATVLPGARLSEVVVDDQAPSWPFDVLVVRRATVQLDSAWLVIHADADGAPGAPIGHTRLARGANTNLVLRLDRPALHEEVLWAQLAADAQPLGTYAHGVDPPVLDERGDPVARAFVVSAPRTTPRLEVSDLVKSGDLERVRVTAAGSDGPGWVVVREDDGLGSPGPIVGQRLIGDGTHTNLDIGVGRRVRDAETFWAELYVDAGQGGVFEPDGADVRLLGPSPFTITLDLEPSVGVADQTLLLSLRLRVDDARTSRGGWLVAQEDDGGAPGAVLGTTAIPDGIVGGTWLPVARPLVDDEVVWVSAWETLGGGAFDPALDAPYEDGEGAPVRRAITVTVPLGTPAARLLLDVADGAFTWATVPAWVGLEDLAPGTLTLREGWRYALLNAAADAHPVAFIADGGAPGLDVVYLSQSGEGLLEEDADIAWKQDGDALAFTVTEALVASVDGYRCELHPDALRGAVSYRLAPEDPEGEPQEPEDPGHEPGE